MRIAETYAIYRGKEYSLISNFNAYGTEEFELVSFESEDVNNGFIKDEKGIYRKRITLEELETAYNFYIWCKYKGYDFQVLAHSEEDDIYDIVHVTLPDQKPVPVEELGFTFKKPGVYMKKVKGEELDSVYKVKSPILGFK